MVTRADVILVAPGGWGTLDEIGTFGVRFKIGEWPAIPVIFLNDNHYWDGFLKFMKQMVKDKAVVIMSSWSVIDSRSHFMPLAPDLFRGIGSKRIFLSFYNKKWRKL